MTRAGKCRPRSLWLAVLAALAASACSGPVTPVSALDVAPDSYDFSKNPQLLERIRSSPHGYFRFINIPFSNEVCRRQQDLSGGGPQLNLHGDAHVEQYAVTDLGRGLTDYDDSSTGPGVIDLMRFGVSLNLACLQNGWEGQGGDMVDRLLAGYLKALGDPTFSAPEPKVAARMRERFQTGREGYFDWIDSIMEPIPPDLATQLENGLQGYVRDMRLENPAFGPDYFVIEKAGALRLGIGSALDKKYLVRIRGASVDASDDVILELKEIRDLEGIECVQATPDDPFRILLSQARIAYKPFRLLGYARFGGDTFWIHAWVDNYREIDIQSTFETPAEMAEVAFDVGVQLGLGHPKLIAAPFDIQVRQSQSRRVERNAEKLKAACRELAGETVEAWKRFVSALNP